MAEIWMNYAKSLEGIKEVPGEESNPVLLNWAKELGFKHYTTDSMGWCALYANHVFYKCKIPGVKGLRARDFYGWGKAVRPEYGALMMFGFTDEPVVTHVTFMIEQTKTHYLCLGGNQSDAVCVTPFPKTKFMGARWPEGY